MLHQPRRPANPPVPHWQRLAASEPAWPSAAPSAFGYAAPFAAPSMSTPGYAAPSPGPGGHPLSEPVMGERLRRQADEIAAAFAPIAPTLARLAPHHFDPDFPARAQRELSAIGVDAPGHLFAAHLMAPPNMRFLQARCVIAAFCGLMQRGFDRSAAERSEGESAAELIARWGFHAIDVATCADGRLAGVLDYILRIPPSVIAFRKSYAGALFNLSDSLRHWETVELGRWRASRPNPASAPTRFLKLGVYHFSSVSPHTEGCAAHGSDTGRAASALLERLEQFEQSVRTIHGATAGVATLLVGVDTDTDAIRVHVPDGSGRMHVARYADSLALHAATARLPREEAKEAVRAAIASCAGVGATDRATEGMRWFCGYLVKNNIAQVDWVRATFSGRYTESGHGEKLIVVGDAADDVQLRNLAFQAQMETVEEGAADLDVGVSILRRILDPQGLAIPILVHFRHDSRVPGSAARAEYKARRLMSAILARYSHIAARKKLFVQAALHPSDGSGLTILDPAPEALDMLETET